MGQEEVELGDILGDAEELLQPGPPPVLLRRHRLRFVEQNDFERRLRVLQTLTHGNCLRLLKSRKLSKEGFVEFITCEERTGEPLSRDSYLLTELSALNLVAQLLAGLREYRKCCRTHGQICPKNIWVERNQTCRLAPAYRPSFENDFHCMLGSLVSLQRDSVPFDQLLNRKGEFDLSRLTSQALKLVQKFPALKSLVSALLQTQEIEAISVVVTSLMAKLGRAHPGHASYRGKLEYNREYLEVGNSWEAQLSSIPRYSSRPSEDLSSSRKASQRVYLGTESNQNAEEILANPAANPEPRQLRSNPFSIKKSRQTVPQRTVSSLLNKRDLSTGLPQERPLSLAPADVSPFQPCTPKAVQLARKSSPSQKPNPEHYQPKSIRIKDEQTRHQPSDYQHYRFPDNLAHIPQASKYYKPALNQTQPVDILQQHHLQVPYSFNQTYQPKQFKASFGFPKVEPVLAPLHSVLRKQAGQVKVPVFVERHYSNGASYRGWTVGGMRQGEGEFTFKDGSVFKGSWRENRIDGSGCLLNPGGSLAYSGQWKDDSFHGRGVFINEAAEPMKSELTRGLLQDLEQVERGMRVYEGAFREGSREGYGRCRMSNGQMVEVYCVGDRVSSVLAVGQRPAV